MAAPPDPVTPPLPVAPPLPTLPPLPVAPPELFKPPLPVDPPELLAPPLPVMELLAPPLPMAPPELFAPPLPVDPPSPVVEVPSPPGLGAGREGDRAKTESDDADRPTGGTLGAHAFINSLALRLRILLRRAF